MIEKRNLTIYGLLAAVFVLACAWLAFEHQRVRERARESLIMRARDISNSLGVVIRSQRRFGMLPARPLEWALSELAESQDLLSIALFNTSGDIVASAGEPIGLPIQDLQTLGAPSWSEDSVTFVNLVDLGAGPDDRVTTEPAPIVVRRSEEEPRDALRPPPPPPPPRRPNEPLNEEATTETLEGFGGQVRQWWESRRGDRAERERGEYEPSRRSGGRDRSFRRPSWLSEEEFQDLLKQQGLHGFVLRISTDAYRSECTRDFWMRLTVAIVSLVAVLGLGLAWRGIDRSNRLQMRLLRAAELNIHLQEMNIAAAGLAHETRNPLNVVRGLAQIIARESSASEDMRKKAGEISEEVDRVTGRLNEFINYSKPPQPRCAPTDLQAVVRDVVRALESDMEDKAIRFELKGPEVIIEADESLLRQVIFNLMMNAVQAVGSGGEVEVRIEKDVAGEAVFEVRDNGPGVAENIRKEIFRPYFTTRKQGSGLGLAVVRQIVLAHHWEVDYVPGRESGAIFRVTGLRAV